MHRLISRDREAGTRTPSTRPPNSRALLMDSSRTTEALTLMIKLNTREFRESWRMLSAEETISKVTLRSLSEDNKKREMSVKPMKKQESKPLRKSKSKNNVRPTRDRLRTEKERLKKLSTKEIQSKKK